MINEDGSLTRAGKIVVVVTSPVMAYVGAIAMFFLYGGVYELVEWIWPN